MPIAAVALGGAAVGVFLAVFGHSAGRNVDAKTARGRPVLTPENPAPASSASAEALASGGPETVEGLIAESHRMAAALVESYPESAEAFCFLGQVHYEFGNSAKATECWQHALKLDPNFAEAYFRIGIAANERGDYETAVDYLRETTLRRPRFTEAHIFLAESLMNLGRAEESVAILEPVSHVRPASPQAWFLLGQAYLQLKAYDKARDRLEVALAVAPGYRHAHYGLATAYEHLEQMEKAEEHRRQFHALFARDADHADRAFLGERGALDLRRVRHTTADLYLVAGEFYRARGHADLAEQHRRRAAALQPDSRQVTSPGELR